MSKEANMRTAEEITEILRQAADVVAAANLPKDFHSVAFGKAVDLIAGIDNSVPSTKSRDEAAGDSVDVLQRIAAKLSVDSDMIGEFFEVDDGEVRLTVAPSKLEAPKSKGAKQIAVLLSAARQAAGIEDWTETKIIREVVDDYGKFDSGNFATALNELGDYLSFSGTSRNRKVKMRKAGFEHAGQLLVSLQG
jgi:hypothetical protein